MPDPSVEARDAVETHAHRMLEHIQHRLQQNLVADISELREELSDLLCRDGTEILGLCLDEQLDLVEEYADELDLQLDNVAIDSLRFQIGSLSADVVAHLGEQRAHDLLIELEQYMNRHDLDLENLIATNHLGMVPHQSERRESDGSTVYEYRGVEGVDIDVYELRLGDSITLFFQKRAIA